MYPEFLESAPKTVWSQKDYFAADDQYLVDPGMRFSFHEGMHCHDFYELNVIVKGSGAHYIENNRMEVSQGDVFILPPLVRHGYYQKETLDVYHILIHTAFFIRYADELSGTPGYRPLFEIEPMLRQYSGERLFLHLSAAEQEQFAGFIAQFDSLKAASPRGKWYLINTFTVFVLTWLCVRYDAFYCRQEDYRAGSDIVRFLHSLERIHRDFDKKLTVEKLAQEIHVSRATYIRKFQQLFRCSPSAYIRDYRIAKARQLLLRTDRSVTEIAQMTGFYDSSHFQRLFTQTTGQSPAAYRKERWT